MASGKTSERAGTVRASRAQRAIGPVAAATIEQLEFRRLSSAADLDPTFGTAGTVAIGVPRPVASVSSSSVVQADGGQSAFDLYPAVSGTPSIGRVAYAPDGALLVAGGIGNEYACAKLDARRAAVCADAY